PLPRFLTTVRVAKHSESRSAARRDYVRVQGRGRLSVRDAIVTALPEIFYPGSDLTTWKARIDGTVAWLTWAELAEQIRRAQREFTSADPSVDAAINRITGSLLTSIEWHDEVV